MNEYVSVQQEDRMIRDRAWFYSLRKRDFENGAVLDEIAQVFKDRDHLQNMVNKSQGMANEINILTKENRQLIEKLKEVHEIISDKSEELRHNELLTIHEILMCPAECPPVTEDDKYTTKLLKGVIQNWHSVEAELQDMKDGLETEYYYKGD